MSKPKRRNKSTPSSSYFLGYVEEDETPESIMKKFEELEKFQKQHSITADQQLTEHQLDELFTRTSAFTVESAMDDLHEWENFESEFAADDQMDSSSEIEAFGHLSSSEPDDLIDADEIENSSSNKNDTEIKSIARIHRKTFDMRETQFFPGIFNISNFIKFPSKRPTCSVEGIGTLKLPNPIPHTWAHIINQRLIEERPYLLLDRKIPLQKIDILACLIDIDGDPALLKNIHVDEFIEKGFLFIWAEKQIISQVVQFAAKFNFKYCENICWIKTSLAHKLHVEDCEYFTSSKLTLLVFRRFRDDEIELKHQRNVDCVFDFIRPKTAYQKPSFIFQIIETLLPLDRQEIAFLHFVTSGSKYKALSTCDYPTPNRWRIVEI